MKRKLNWPGHANTASRIAACKLSTNTASTCTALARGVADTGFTWVHLTSGSKNPQMFAR